MGQGSLVVKFSGQTDGTGPLENIRSLRLSTFVKYHSRLITKFRFRIGPSTKDSAESEQAFSDDGGTTWETNRVNNYTRVH